MDSLHDVHVLRPGCTGTRLAEIPLVEEIHDHHADGESLTLTLTLNLTVQRIIDPKPIHTDVENCRLVFLEAPI